jgi:hypothetical protein
MGSISLTGAEVEFWGEYGANLPQRNWGSLPRASLCSCSTGAANVRVCGESMPRLLPITSASRTSSSGCTCKASGSGLGVVLEG